MQKISIIDFWLGSKYSSWRYCQKKIYKNIFLDIFLKIFPKLCKTFCIFILIMDILFCRQNQKNVLQKEIKDCAFKPIYWLKKPVLDSCWLDHWKWCQGLMRVVLEFLSNGEGLDRSSRYVLPKLIKIIVTSPKSVKRNKQNHFWFGQS